eukprot:m.25513 g.25513  ORF g.25513 m.25513 type:complete len:992 (+) comp28823_c0_seq4:28-3003(+)
MDAQWHGRLRPVHEQAVHCLTRIIQGGSSIGDMLHANALLPSSLYEEFKRIVGQENPIVVARRILEWLSRIALSEGVLERFFGILQDPAIADVGGKELHEILTLEHSGRLEIQAGRKRQYAVLLKDVLEKHQSPDCLCVEFGVELVTIPQFLEAVGIMEKYKSRWMGRIKQVRPPHLKLVQLIEQNVIRYTLPCKGKGKKRKPSSPVSLSSNPKRQTSLEWSATCPLKPIEASSSLPLAPVASKPVHSVTESFKKISILRENLLQKLKDGLEQWPLRDYKKKLEELECDQPKSYFGFYGYTGCGKSTLINALVGASVLPSSEEGRSCTSVPVWVGCHSSGEDFQAEIKFLAKEEWEEERKALCDSLDTDSSSPDDESTAALEKLQAVYGPKEKSESTNDFIARTESTSGPVAHALDEGEKKLSRETAERLFADLVSYIEPRKEHPQYWPLITEVNIALPLKQDVGRICENNAVLVDLPGVGDRNTALAKTVEMSLRQCSHVVAAADTKRITSQDIQFPSDVSRKVENGEVIVAYVATSSDKIERPIIILRNHNEQPTGKKRVDKRRAAHLRKEKVKLELCMELQNKPLSIKCQPIFVVSAADYMNLNDFPDYEKEDAVFDDKKDTEIPALKSFIQKESKKLAVRKLLSLAEEIEDFSEEMCAFLDEEGTKDIARIKTIKEAFANSSKELESSLQSSHKDVESKLQEFMAGPNSKIAVHARDAAESGKANHTRLVKSWEDCFRRYPTTLRAACSRGGEFTSRTQGTIKLNHQLAVPVEEALQSAWNEVFDDSGTTWDIISEWEKENEDKRESARKTLFALEDTVNTKQFKIACKKEDSNFINEMNKLQEKVQRMLENQRDSLSDVLEDTFRKELKKVYASCALCKGAELAKQITTTMEKKTPQESLYSEVEKALIAKTKDLGLGISSALKEVKEKVINARKRIFAILWKERDQKKSQELRAVVERLRQYSQNVSKWAVPLSLSLEESETLES